MNCDLTVLRLASGCYRLTTAPPGPCEDITIEVPKSVLKQGAVQHLYGRLAARLRRGRNDAHVLSALHPTPAVCGRPRDGAMR